MNRHCQWYQIQGFVNDRNEEETNSLSMKESGYIYEIVN
jgi:hypothetical protein